MTFDPPGFLDDLNADGKAKWHQWISDQFDRVRSADGTEVRRTNYGPRLQFFNPSKTPPGAGAVEKDVTWSAFPRIVELQSASDKQRWRTADASRDVQDEYCEWSVTRDPPIPTRSPGSRSRAKRRNTGSSSQPSIGSACWRCTSSTCRRRSRPRICFRTASTTRRIGGTIRRP